MVYPKTLYLAHVRISKIGKLVFCCQDHESDDMNKIEAYIGEMQQFFDLNHQILANDERLKRYRPAENWSLNSVRNVMQKNIYSLFLIYSAVTQGGHLYRAILFHIAQPTKSSNLGEHKEPTFYFYLIDYGSIEIITRHFIQFYLGKSIFSQSLNPQHAEDHFSTVYPDLASLVFKLVQIPPYCQLAALRNMKPLNDREGKIIEQPGICRYDHKIIRALETVSYTEREHEVFVTTNDNDFDNSGMTVECKSMESVLVSRAVAGNGKFYQERYGVKFRCKILHIEPIKPCSPIAIHVSIIFDKKSVVDEPWCEWMEGIRPKHVHKGTEIHPTFESDFTIMNQKLQDFYNHFLQQDKYLFKIPANNPPTQYGIFIYFHGEYGYVRVQVTLVDEINSLCVITLVDYGETIFNVKFSDIRIAARLFQNIPARAIPVMLLNVLSPSSQFDCDNLTLKLRELKKYDFNHFLSSGRHHPEGYILGDFIKFGDDMQLLSESTVFSEALSKKFMQINVKNFICLNTVPKIMERKFEHFKIKPFRPEHDEFLTVITHVHEDCSINVYCGDQKNILNSKRKISASDPITKIVTNEYKRICHKTPIMSNLLHQNYFLS